MRVAGTARERDLRTLSAAIGLSALGDGVALVARAPGEEPRRRGDGGRGRDRRDVHLPPGTRRPALGVWRAARRPTGDAAPARRRVGSAGSGGSRPRARRVARSAARARGGARVRIAVAQAAEFALVPVVAGDQELQRANRLVETARALGLTVGPVCGSVLVALGGTAAAMAVDAVSLLVVGLIGARPTLWLAGGLSALAGLAGLAVLASWRSRAPEPDLGTGTIGPP